MLFTRNPLMVIGALVVNWLVWLTKEPYHPNHTITWLGWKQRRWWMLGRGYAKTTRKSRQRARRRWMNQNLWPVGYMVGLYEVHRELHPEEGGTPHDVASLYDDDGMCPVPVRWFWTEAGATAYQSVHEKTLAELNKDRRPLHSVLSNGRFDTRISRASLWTMVPMQESEPYHYE